jgi:hypothetical protein
MPRLLNYVIAIYLIMLGAIGLNSLSLRSGPGAPRPALHPLDRVGHATIQLYGCRTKTPLAIPSGGGFFRLARLMPIAARAFRHQPGSLAFSRRSLVELFEPCHEPEARHRDGHCKRVAWLFA